MRNSTNAEDGASVEKIGVQKAEDEPWNDPKK